jgi:FkbM family methyltransferase
MLNPNDIPNIPHAFSILAAQGFAPACIYDIGANQGDFVRQCLEYWPQAHFVCFEPLQGQVAELRAMARQYPQGQIRVIEGLLGNDDRAEVVFHEAGTGSSVLAEHVNKSIPTRLHPMRTLATARSEFDLPLPTLLKLDVQGFELEILKGGESLLGRAEVILSEVNFLDIHENVPLAGDIMHWLNERNFVLYDICGMGRRPLDGALWQADFLFVKKDGYFRQDKTWMNAAPAELLAAPGGR